VASDVAALLTLIVTEAVTNAIKYSHPTGVPGKITVSCGLDRKDGLAIQVIDDGVGLPEIFDTTSGGSSGFRLMRALSEKLGAALSFKSTTLGLAVGLRVPHANLSQDGWSRTPAMKKASVMGELTHGDRGEPSALYRFTDRLLRSMSPSDAYAAALDAIEQALDCRRASILLFDDAGVMRFVASRGLSDSYQKAVAGHSPWTRQVKDPQPICVEHVPKSDLPETLKAVVKQEGIGALAFIPLVARGKLIGKFMTYYDGPHAFGPAELDLALTIARQLGFGVEHLREEQASRLLALIIETSGDAIVSKDLNGIVTSWNRGAERLFGYSAEEMVGKSITTLIPAGRHDEEPGILDRVRRGERIEHYETVRQRKDGSTVDISLSISPVINANGKVIGASKIARDITERKEAAARQELLTREIQHRTKNLFAVVQAVVARSFVGKQTVKDAEAAVLNRLRSLAQTHVLLMDNEWQGAELGEVLRAEMSPYGNRVRIEGPPVELSAKAAQSFALAVHELATNAAKYGALSSATGRVSIHWSTQKSNGSGLFHFRWEEQGGPAVSPPSQKGFGGVVLEQVMADYFVEPRLDFAVGGVCYELIGELANLS